MKQIFSLLLLVMVALSLGACHCKTCYVGGPGNMCEPCPKPPKPLKKPMPKKRCELPLWPERPVKCVTTQIVRKCCHTECCTTKDGYPFQIEVCEITYKSLYTDGSSKIWTEVSRNPVSKSPTKYKKSNTGGPRFSLVGDRCDDCTSVPSKIQHMDKHLEKNIFKASHGSQHGE